MKRLLLVAVSVLALSAASSAFAQQQYPAVSTNDAQYGACLAYSLTKYEGGADKSPIAGQTKAEAWCTCMWHETSDDFRGSLAKFGETANGARINAMCEKYANWGN